MIIKSHDGDVVYGEVNKDKDKHSQSYVGEVNKYEFGDSYYYGNFNDDEPNGSGTRFFDSENISSSSF